MCVCVCVLSFKYIFFVKQNRFLIISLQKIYRRRTSDSCQRYFTTENQLL